MNQQKLIELFKSFCADPGKEHRQALLSPFRVGNIAFATDAVKMIAVPIDKLNFELPFAELDKESFRNSAMNIYNGKLVNPVELTFAELKEKAVPLTTPEKVYDTCNKCDGEGECDHCGQTCPQCEGDGFVDEGKLTGRTIIDPAQHFKFNNGTCIYANVLDNLSRVCQSLGVDQFVYYSEAPNKAQIFLLPGDIKVILMPIMVNQNQEQKEILADIGLKPQTT